MQYEVRALSSDAMVEQFSVDALDEADARRQVEARGLFVAAIRRRGGARAKGGMSLVLFSQELLALLSAGLGVVEALEALLEKEASPVLANVLARLLAGLREGKRFSSVLAEQGDRFPPLYIGIVKAAEGTSDLPRSLSRYIDYQQRIDVVRAKIVSAATAFTRGSRPRRAREKITIGMVDEPGPDRKADSTTSSSDKVNVSSHAEPSACLMFGSVTRKNTWYGLQPRSMAASSSDLLISCKRDCTTTAA